MKKATKIIAVLVIGLFIVTAALIGYVKIALPDTGPAPELNVEITPQRVERGKYLANHITVCMDCHSPRDWTKFSGPLLPNRLGAGGEKFDHTVGFPGEVYVPNITPARLRNWTDGEIFRAVTTGVKKDGSAIFPIMPYKFYGKMDKEDIYSIIAYIRTLPAQESTTEPERELDFPLNFLVNTMPANVSSGKIPSKENKLAYGAYLVNAAACYECHTPSEKGEHIAEMAFAGGADYGLPSGTVHSANITPDKETGIGNWTKEQFVSRFKAFADSTYHVEAVGPDGFQTIMPWRMYSGMEESDLEAIYTYLKTLKPVRNRVVKFTPKTALAAKNQ